LEREIGVPPIELAQTHRLLLAKQLLGDTSLSVTRIAYASGFQSLRRFNSVFRDRYGLNPSAARRARRVRDAGGPAIGAATIPARDLVRLTLSYRAPLAWDALLACLHRDAMPEVEMIDGGSYMRTVRVDGRSGIVIVQDAGADDRDRRRPQKTHVNVALSSNLLPVLMPLIARLRQVFDLDAEPLVIDSHLEKTGLGTLVRRRPGLRIPGALDGFEVVLRSVLRGSARASGGSNMNLARIVSALGEPISTGIATLTRLAPTAARIAEAGAMRLTELGVAPRSADAIASIARAIANGTLVLEPGSDVVMTCEALMEIGGISNSLATEIVMRTLLWPDSFPTSDRALQRAAGASSSSDLRVRAEEWRPWRAYAALHLRLKAKLANASCRSESGARRHA
jgi:AraC family transcriptional regulator of adaptative response / DNA-3-methyladenine glycosylase II